MTDNVATVAAVFELMGPESSGPPPPHAHPWGEAYLAIRNGPTSPLFA